MDVSIQNIEKLTYAVIEAHRARLYAESRFGCVRDVMERLERTLREARVGEYTTYSTEFDGERLRVNTRVLYTPDEPAQDDYVTLDELPVWALEVFVRAYLPEFLNTWRADIQSDVESLNYVVDHVCDMFR